MVKKNHPNFLKAGRCLTEANKGIKQEKKYNTNKLYNIFIPNNIAQPTQPTPNPVKTKTRSRGKPADSKRTSFTTLDKWITINAARKAGTLGKVGLANNVQKTNRFPTSGKLLYPLTIPVLPTTGQENQHPTNTTLHQSTGSSRLHIH